MNLGIFYQNVRGIRTKTKDFFTNVLHLDYDIICIAETWLLPGVYDSEIFDYRYCVYRCDRDYESRGDKMGGGVLIAIRKGITVIEVSNQPSNDTRSCDMLSLLIRIKKSTKPRI